jgi:hypothetical protein
MSQALISSAMNLTKGNYNAWFPILVNIERSEYAEKEQNLRDHLDDLAASDSFEPMALNAAQRELAVLDQKHRAFLTWAQNYRSQNFVNATRLLIR